MTPYLPKNRKRKRSPTKVSTISIPWRSPVKAMAKFNRNSCHFIASSLPDSSTSTSLFILLFAAVSDYCYVRNHSDNWLGPKISKTSSTWFKTSRFPFLNKHSTYFDSHSLWNRILSVYHKSCLRHDQSLRHNPGEAGKKPTATWPVKKLLEYQIFAVFCQILISSTSSRDE